MTKRALVASLIGLASALAGCGEQELPVPSYFLSGAMTTSSLDANGRWAYLRLVEPGGGPEAEVLYLARCQLTGPSCEYQINQVLEGEYTAHALVDLNGNARMNDPQADTGDLVAPARPLLMWDRQQLDYPDSAWRLQP
jgi:hypothetical protein